MRQIKYIIFHCTAGPQTQKPDDILAYWKNVLKWSRPGYHMMIEADGTVHELQPIELPTNGVAGYNANSIHINYIGGVDAHGRAIDNRTEAQKEKLKFYAEKFHKMFPDAKLMGHRDFSPDKNRDGIIQPGEWMKACPCYSVKEWIQEIGLIKNPVMPIIKKAVHTQSGVGVNLRQGAGTNYAVVAPVADGTACMIIRELNGWVEVQISDKLKGFIKADYLK